MSHLSLEIKLKNPVLDIVILVLFLIGAFILSQAIGSLLVLTQVDSDDLVKLYTSEAMATEHQHILLLSQAVMSFIIFIAAPLLWVKLKCPDQFPSLFNQKANSFRGIWLVLLVFLIMPFIAKTYDWNKGLTMPDSLGALESWMQMTEARAEKMTKALTTVKNPYSFPVVLLVIAVIPAIGEEILFRGIVMRLMLTSASPLIAIVASAAFFSAFHMQFYGFVPRMVLGILFGLMYVYTKNIWIPILAHFINNGFTLLMLALYQHQVIGINIEESESVSLGWALLSVLLTSAVFYFFVRINQRQHN